MSSTAKTLKAPDPKKVKEVNEFLQKSAFFSLFSVPNPDSPNDPILAKFPFPFSFIEDIPYLGENLMAGVSVNEGPKRLKTETNRSGVDLLGVNQVGEEIATVHIDWTPIPWSYNAKKADGKDPDSPPQTILNPLLPQRFEMLNGEFRFLPSGESGFNGFGAGQTFPRGITGGLSLDIGACITMVRGLGDFNGARGMIVVNGFITPPKDLALNLMARIIDPDGKYQADCLPPIQDPKIADPSGTFLIFNGEPKPTTWIRFEETGEDESISYGSQGKVVEELRLADFDFAKMPDNKVKSKKEVKGHGGSMSLTLNFNPDDPRNVIPFTTSDGVFSFTDENGATIGTITADLVEGRAFKPDPLLDDKRVVEYDVYRMGGFGKIKEGTGYFEGIEGMLSMNSVLSVKYGTMSNVYVFRIDDPDGKYRSK